MGENVIFNGGFETGDFSGWRTSFTGWGTHLNEVIHSADHYPDPAPEGDWFAKLYATESGVASISQDDVDFTNLTSISFWFLLRSDDAGWKNPEQINYARLWVGSTIIWEYDTHTGGDSPDGYYDWEICSADVSAMSGVQTLKFEIVAYYDCTISVGIDGIYAEESIPIPTAAFEAIPRLGLAPLEVQFTDLSTNSEMWLWQFGDGTTSNTQHPAHTYEVPGLYSVALTVANYAGQNSVVAQDYILVLPPVGRRRRAAWQDLERPLYL